MDAFRESDRSYVKLPDVTDTTQSYNWNIQFKESNYVTIKFKAEL